MKIYAEGGVKANFKGIVDNANLEDLVADIVDAAEKMDTMLKKYLVKGYLRQEVFIILNSLMQCRLMMKIK